MAISKQHLDRRLELSRRKRSGGHISICVRLEEFHKAKKSKPRKNRHLPFDSFLSAMRQSMLGDKKLFVNSRRRVAK